jgi:hypothetical protein
MPGTGTGFCADADINFEGAAHGFAMLVTTTQSSKVLIRDRTDLENKKQQSPDSIHQVVVIRSSSGLLLMANWLKAYLHII